MPFFSDDIYRQRRTRACAALRAAGYETFLALHPTTLHWLTGSEAKSYQSFQCLLLDTRDESLTLFLREGELAEVAETALYDHLAGWSAFAGDDPMVALSALLAKRDLAGPCAVEVVQWYLNPAQHAALREMLGPFFVPAGDIVNALRLVRGPEELDCLRRAGRIADAAIAAFADALKPGRRECDLAAAIYGAILSAGGDAPPVPLNLCGGPRAAFAHGAPTDRRVEPCESGNAEFAVPWKRYTVSIGRSYALGPVPQRLAQMYAAVEAAQESMFSVLRAGVTAAEVHAAGMDVFRSAGMDQLVTHTIGYSVAPAFPPATGDGLGLSDGSKRRLEAGMTLSIAPNLFCRDEKIGTRLVNNVIVATGGIERLSRYGDALIVAA